MLWLRCCRGSWEAPEQSAHLLATVMDTAVALPIALGGRSSSCVAFFLWPLLARRPSFFSIYWSSAFLIGNVCTEATTDDLSPMPPSSISLVCFCFWTSTYSILVFGGAIVLHCMLMKWLCYWTCVIIQLGLLVCATEVTMLLNLCSRWFWTIVGTI